MDIVSTLSDGIDWPLVLSRAVTDMAVLLQFGAVLAVAWLARPVFAVLGSGSAALGRRLARLAGLSIGAAVLATIVSFDLQSTAIAGSVAYAPSILMHTSFGHFVLARLVLLLAAAVASARNWLALATVLAGAAVATGAGMGHAWAMEDGPSWLLLSNAVHLLAAAAWLGSLLPLMVLVAGAPPASAQAAALRFSMLGTVCVAALVVTAAAQSAVLVGSFAGLLGTEYGWAAMAKLGLFAVLLGFAANNRFRLIPPLAAAAPADAKRRLLRSIAAETVAGVLIVLAAGLLSSLAPAIDADPF